MAGSSISITIDDSTLVEALNRVIAKTHDLQPAFAQIGEYLDLASRQRFDHATAPDGTPWADNSELTQALKGRNEPLVQGGDLRDLLRYDASSDTLEFGSDRIYAAMHQFGGKTSPRSKYPNATIPARPFLGVSSQDQDVILDILRDFLASAE